MRRIFTPPTSLLLTLLSVLLTPVLGVGQIHVRSTHPFFSGSGAVALKASVTPWPNRTAKPTSVVSAEVSFPLAPVQSTETLRGRIVDPNGAVVNGVANTLRPDVVGPVQMVGSLDRWFDTNALTQVARFGSLGRNVIIGPGFSNLDFSLSKSIDLDEQMRLQFRAEVFDLFNHPSFGQPGRVVGSATFGRITNTRFPTGDSGSSRQLQFAVKLMF